MFRPCLCACACVLLGIASMDAAPMVEKYLLEGKLTEGEKALVKHLSANPKDDEARFGLGVIQFFQSFEHLGQSLYKYGFRANSTFQISPALRRLLPENPKPEKLTHADLDGIIKRWVADIDRAGKTLDAIQDNKVKLPLHVGKISLDLFGTGQKVNAAILLGVMEPGGNAQQVAEKFLIAFDRADVHWLRGYCHFLTAWGEFILALDGRELFECVGHRLFVKIESPHAFLQEEDNNFRNIGFGPGSFPQIIDIITTIHLTIRMPVREPARMKKVLDHLLGMVSEAKKMWPLIVAETDDDHEWIPNPKQKGVVGVQVTQEIIDNWLKTLDEAELILQGKSLLPFWRGKKKDLGVNLRLAFLNPPRDFDLIRWVQGTAATPYLQNGKITPLSDPATIRRLDRVFGGFGFFGFAFWFN